ncbi:MAG: thioredoxin family protein [Fuerstiella sp.]|nr:thioredoxin [Candidatus Nitrosopelagicus sp.]
MAVRWVILVAALFLLPGLSTGRERTVDEFKAYAARRMVNVDQQQLAEFVAQVDSNADGTITDVEFASRIVVFQRIFKSVPMTAQRSGHALPENWLTDFAKAREASVETGKPIVAMFSASWCGPCKRMIANVYPTDEAKDALTEFIPVYIDSEKHRDLATKNSIHSFPTFICFDVDGESVEQHVGGGDVMEFVEMLKTFKVAVSDAQQASKEQKSAVDI